MIKLTVTCILTLIAVTGVAGLEWDTLQKKIAVHPTQVAAETVFKFSNTGDTPVTVVQLKSACGCLVPQLKESTYAPGTGGELRVIVDLRGRSGHFSKSVMILTDDGVEVSLHIEADIPRTYEISPVMMKWSEGAGGTKTAILRNLNKQPVRLLSASSSSPDLPVQLNVIREGYEYEVTVTRRSVKDRARAVIRIETEPPPGMEESRTLRMYADAR